MADCLRINSAVPKQASKQASVRSEPEIERIFRMSRLGGRVGFRLWHACADASARDTPQISAVRAARGTAGKSRLSVQDSSSPRVRSGVPLRGSEQMWMMQRLIRTSSYSMSSAYVTPKLASSARDARHGERAVGGAPFARSASAESTARMSRVQ